MLGHDLRFALRTLRRHPGYAALNVAGLAVGIACCLLLLLYVQGELRYDRFHRDAEAVVRITTAPQPDRVIAVAPAHVAALVAALPAVEATARLTPRAGLVRAGGRAFEDARFVDADASLLDVLTYRTLYGDAAAALATPASAVLTETAARRYFGRADAVGETLSRDDTRDLQVGAVLADPPRESHLQFDLLTAFPTPPDDARGWWNANYYTYARAHDAAAARALPAQLDALVARLAADGEAPWALGATPLPDLHLHSVAEDELGTAGSLAVVTGFAVVALLILLIACINYMNLATARAAQRAEEVGLRKSLGAFRSQLVVQFYGEAAALTLGGVALALALVALSLPAFNALAGTALTFGALAHPALLGLLAALFVVVTVVAGSYPAVRLSAAEPVRALRGTLAARSGPSRLRQGLVVFQFGVSAVLVVGALVVLSQIRFLASEDLGFDREHVVVLPLADAALQQASPAMQAAIAASPAVRSVSAVNRVPGEIRWSSTLRGGQAGEDGIPAKGLPADAGVADALGLTVVAGAAFPETPPTPDSTNFLFLLNERAAARLGWTPTQAVGEPVAVDDRRGTVQGVVRDFHVASLHEPIEPIAIWYQPDAVYSLTARLAPGQTRAGLDHLEAVWGAFASHRPFRYRFLDEVQAELYRGEQRLGRVVGVFAGLAVLVACLGLFGLAAFTAQQRTKEIGVRKVLGATVADVVALLTREVVALVTLAVGVALPLAWVAAGRWLDGYAYHVGLGPGPFLATAALLLAVAVVTVGGHALRAARADPVRALRAD